MIIETRLWLICWIVCITHYTRHLSIPDAIKQPASIKKIGEILNHDTRSVVCVAYIF